MGKKNISLTELCYSITGEYEVLGDSDRRVSIASPIDKAGKESVTFCSKSTEDGLQLIRNSRAGVIISSKELSYREEDYKDKTLILVSDPRLAFIQVMQKYFQEKIEFGISPTAVIDKDAKIHPSVYIGPNSYIGKCEIGENTVIDGNVYIYSGVVIGRNAVIQTGAVIGAESTHFHRNNQTGEWEKFPQIGGVIIGDDVEIGSNTSIMRGALGDTVIGRGTKIGHLCSIGHGVTIGKHCYICSHSALAGSSRIGDYSEVWLGSRIRNWVEVGRNAVVGMGAVVTKNVGDGKVVFGVPAEEQGETNWLFGGSKNVQ